MSTFFNIQHRTDTDGVAILTFDRPESRANILDRAVWDDLHRALKSLRVRPGVTGLVLASAKPGIFIAGADLKFLGAIPQPNDPRVKELMEFGLSTLELLEKLPFPTCAAINGATLGGGLEVALACDFRVLGPDPKVQLGLPEITLGLIPGWGGSQRLLRVIPWELAVQMLTTGTSIQTAEALSSGLAISSTTGDVIEEAIRVLHTENREATRIAKREALPLLEREFLKEAVLALGETTDPALRELYSVLVRGSEQPQADALPIETAAFCRLTGSAEANAKIAAFFASRSKK
jgi:enoyl-CoA hydratase/carnithine racemase